MPLSSVNLPAVTLRMGHTPDHFHFSLKVTIFFRLLPLSALLLIANQGGNLISKVSSMLQKTTHVVYGRKTI